jgi:Fungal protein kinase
LRQDEFNYAVFDRGGSIMTPFLKVHTFPKIFLRLILGIAFADRRFIGYDTSIYGQGTSRRVKLDLASHEQGLRDLELQLVLHMTARVNSRGSTVRLLKVTGDQVSDFYGHSGDGWKSPPGMKLGKPFGIVCKDTWEEPHDELSEGCILQLLHAKGVHGVLWCLDEKPVIVPDAPPLPPGVETTESYVPQSFLDNTMYTRSRWGIRSLQVSNTAKSAIWRVEKKRFGLMPSPPQVQVPAGILPTLQVTSLGHGTAGEKNAKGNLQWKDAGEAGPLFLAPSSPSSVHASTSTQDPSLYQSISASEAHIPRVATGPVPCHQFTMRCHVRSYMYPVGTPIFWFGSVLELLCVLRDLIRSE